jgi:hypothetical protein
VWHSVPHRTTLTSPTQNQKPTLPSTCYQASLQPVYKQATLHAVAGLFACACSQLLLLLLRMCLQPATAASAAHVPAASYCCTCAYSQLQLLLLHMCLQQRCCRCSTHAHYSTQQQQVHAVAPYVLPATAAAAAAAPPLLPAPAIAATTALSRTC